MLDEKSLCDESEGTVRKGGFDQFLLYRFPILMGIGRESARVGD